MCIPSCTPCDRVSLPESELTFRRLYGCRMS
ncbi:Uncharacterised protein [Vibrio cholerae]|nr:Uncharacterised protein [Vibrio cholerae]